MIYISTRGAAPPLGFGDVLLTGLASDGGLYVPETWPTFSLAEFVEAHGADADYAALATEVMWPYVEGFMEREAFAAVVVETYATFEHEDVVPLRDLGEGRHLLELFHGPTLAFKDIALQLVGRLFEHELDRRDEHVTIVVATSGDTGSAAIEAVRDRETIEIFVLHPHERTSPLQRRQMTTVVADNVHNIAVEGTFDDCQDLVKAMFADEGFRSSVHLSAVNSINWARVMAQIVYYWWAALRLGRIDEPIAFAVPTGNFGNVFAGFCARRMGLDVAQLVVGSNNNDVLTQFFNTGKMTIGSVEPTLSPSMDIQVSSNLERLLFEVLGRDGEAVADLFTLFREDGAVEVDAYRLGALRETWDAARVSDTDTVRMIADVFAGSSVVVDPHTAVGLAAAQACRRFDEIPMVALATAHPAKFPAAIESAIGETPDLPPALAAVADRAEHFDVLPNDLAAIEQHILSRRSRSDSRR